MALSLSLSLSLSLCFSLLTLEHHNPSLLPIIRYSIDPPLLHRRNNKDAILVLHKARFAQRNRCIFMCRSILVEQQIKDAFLILTMARAWIWVSTITMARFVLVVKPNCPLLFAPRL